MKIFITGGTGFVGSNLARTLLDRGHEVTVVGSSGKSPLGEHPLLHVLQANTTRQGLWQEGLSSFDVIVNLAGRSIFNYWTDSYKESMYSSRILTTRNIVQALPARSEVVLLNASAVGYYGDSGETEVDEGTGPGSGFLAELASDWEREADAARSKGARVAVMRFGIVLGKGGGALATMKTPFKMGLGGTIGSGKQWFPWIHLEDLVSAIVFLMDAGDLDGPFNCVAPEQVRQKDFAKTMAGVFNRPAVLPVPSFVLKTLGGEFGQILLEGQKVEPKALLDRGFLFRHPRLEEALRHILL